jgi:hypothetical protein
MLHNGTLQKSTFQNGLVLQNGTVMYKTLQLCTKRYMWQNGTLLQNGTLQNDSLL